MSNNLWKAFLASPAVLGFALAGSAFAADAAPSVETLEVATTGSVELAQITGVDELSDVFPSDWAYTALQNLVNTYGCIEGYPNRTFRGNQPLTRYEFAAGLNACLDVISQLIGVGGVEGTDLSTIQRLQQEFAAELATLRGRVDALEAQTAQLRAQQFSTTTKLRGQVDAHLGLPFDSLDGADDSATFVSRARLNFDTSFTGQDRLRIRMQYSSGNAPLDSIGGYNNASGSTTSQVRIDDFYYQFPIGGRINAIVAARGIVGDDFVTTDIVPWSSTSVGDPGGPQWYDSGVGGQSSDSTGFGLSFALTDAFVIDLGYANRNANTSNPTVGLFGGQGNAGTANESYIAQVNFLTERFSAAVAYIHSDGAAIFSDYNNTGGGAIDTFGGSLSFDFGSFILAGTAGYSDYNGGSDFSWLAGIEVPDLFIEGTKLGLFAGELPAIYGSTQNPFYAEGYYNIPVSRFFTLTPAIIYGSNLTGGAGGDDSALWGAIRTTFRF